MLLPQRAHADNCDHCDALPKTQEWPGFMKQKDSRCGESGHVTIIHQGQVLKMELVRKLKL
jgi:hypothetical protein